jgi:D-apiose dehydrogenase
MVSMVGLCGEDRGQVTQFAAALGGPTINLYTDLGTMLAKERELGLVDLITTTPTHFHLAKQILENRIPVIVQKPMAQTLSQAIAMVKASHLAMVPLLVHENFRFQRPFAVLKRLIDENRERLGPLVDIRADWESGGEDFLRGQPYFNRQPFLVNGEVGVHLIDVLRYLSAANVTRVVSAQMHRGVDSRYTGEDLAHVTLDMQKGVTASYRAAFSAAHKDERPPQTFVRMIFRGGTLELGPDYQITATLLERKAAGGIDKKVTTVDGSPESSRWTGDPALQDYQSWLGQWESTLPTNRACAEFVTGNGKKDSGAITGEDNLNVLATTYGAYLASESDSRVDIPGSIEGLEELAKKLELAKIGYPEFPDGDVAR